MSKYGLPDYGMYAALENMGNLVDYGELAARLGSIVTFNREGNIVFWDDFEKTPLKWTQNLYLNRGFIGYSDLTANSGGQSVLMETGIIINDYASIERYFSVFTDKQIGFEIGVNHNQTNGYLMMYIYPVISGVIYYYGIQIDYQNGLIRWMKTISDFETIESDFKPALKNHLFHQFKLVIDNEAHEYVRFMFDRNEYNLEGKAPLSMPSGEYESITIQLVLVTKASAMQSIYVDNFILTQNEP